MSYTFTYLNQGVDHETTEYLTNSLDLHLIKHFHIRPGETDIVATIDKKNGLYNILIHFHFHNIHLFCQKSSRDLTSASTGVIRDLERQFRKKKGIYNQQRKRHKRREAPP